MPLYLIIDAPNDFLPSSCAASVTKSFHSHDASSNLPFVPLSTISGAMSSSPTTSITNCAYALLSQSELEFDLTVRCVCPDFFILSLSAVTVYLLLGSSSLAPPAYTAVTVKFFITLSTSLPMNTILVGLSSSSISSS